MASESVAEPSTPSVRRVRSTQVGAGASLGPEGPLVHLGAMAGSFLTGGVRLRQTMPSFFRV